MFFFFQAEDGIRDYKVTGVQTCALPIFPSHLFVLGQVLLPHPAFAQLVEHVIAVGDDLAHQIVRRRGGPQRLPVVGAEPHVVGILGRANGADLHAGISMRSSLSPTRTREAFRSGMSPRAASAMPLRLFASTTTKSATC